MSQTQDVIHLWTKENKKGARINALDYRQVALFILAKLASAKDNTILLVDLLKKAELENFERISGNSCWYVLQVKQDLEARRIITCAINRDRSQEIRLNRRQFKKQQSELASRLGDSVISFRC